MTVKRVTVEFTKEDMKSVAIMANHIENKDEYDEQTVTDAIERATRFWNEMYRAWWNENRTGMTNETK
jgi:hypothetical protein